MNRYKITKIATLAVIPLMFALHTYGQVEDEYVKVVKYDDPREYEIADISISGVKYLDRNALISISGLVIGSKIIIPGDEITNAIKKFWDHGLFADVKIYITKIENNLVYLELYLQERPRLSKYTIEGLKKSELEDIEEKLNLRRGTQVTDNVILTIETIIKNHFHEKGYYNAEVDIVQTLDTLLQNQVKLDIKVEKNKKVKIKDIVFIGNENIPDKKLKKAMKNTKKRNLNIFKSSKFVSSNYKDDKNAIITKYNEKGYRDAEIIFDSLTMVSHKRIKLTLGIYEGKKYYFGNITWIGNTIYPSEMLSAVLGIKKGDIFDQTLLDQRLFSDEDAVNSLYLDNGYLFSSITPVEIKIENDSIDYEMRIYEGEQATINEVIITGNNRTNEHVIRREIRTVPGELFSKSDIIRTIRELAQLGHFDPEKIEPIPIPDPDNSTVDLQYNLEEKHNDQLEVSGGWGANMFVGTIGVRFTNFSTRNIFNRKAWRPIPTGDGQTLSLRAQTNGEAYRGYNMTFVEPWFGGKKPNSFSFSIFRTVQKERKGYSYTDFYDRYFKIFGASIGLGRRLKWPDDYFTLYNEIGYTRYALEQWQYFLFTDGYSNSLSFLTNFARNSSGPNPIYPMQGSNFSLSLELTPPFSLVNNRDYSNAVDSIKYKWIEYHKWKFRAEWYLTLVDKLVLSTRANFGYLGYYNKDIGPSPFESFDLGGDGMSGYTYYGYEIIAQRGYANSSLTPRVNYKKSGNIYNKYTFELRYPLLMNPQSTFYILSFLEGGNCWYSIDTFNPFIIKRAAGIGIRAFLPMFGMLGVDWGYGFDDIPGQPDANHSQFHFIIGNQF